MHNIDYDFIIANQSNNFMKETLRLWGIPSNKIIDPYNESFCIEGEEVIVPSLVSNVNFGFVSCSCYAQPHLLRYVQEKLLNNALKEQPIVSMNKKIFISRKDSPIRNIINEDEIFSLLEPYGFVRYELSKLSVVDQIHLFNQAEIIVSPQGTGLANSIFCNKNVKIIELFSGA
jgi:capsular polysaccharide biosynthesis protein